VCLGWCQRVSTVALLLLMKQQPFSKWKSPDVEGLRQTSVSLLWRFMKPAATVDTG
jgi:hypothetical protein